MPSIRRERKTEMAEGKKVGFKLYSHYLWFAITVGLFLAFACWFLDSGVVLSGSFWLVYCLGIAMYLILGTAIIHTSIWSVFGDRGIVKRTLVSIGIFSIVLAGAIAGYAVVAWGYDLMELMQLAQAWALLALPLIVAAQVPFWFLRGAFGWQLVRDGEQPVVISLNQLFLITLVFGIAFATPSIAGRVLSSAAAENQLAVGSTHFTTVAKEDGTYDVEEIEVTLENRAELLLEQNQFLMMRINSTMLYGSAVLATLSFLSIPVFWFAFRRGRRKAFLYSVLYAVFLYGLVGVGCVPFYGLRYFLIQISPSVIFGLAVSVFLIVAPLLISKAKGFWLSTGRVHPAKAEEQFQPVVDPLA